MAVGRGAPRRCASQPSVRRLDPPYQVPRLPGREGFVYPIFLFFVNTCGMGAEPTEAESYLLIDELEETLAAGSGRDCEKMMQRVADLFMAGSRRYSDRQIALFDDVLLR